LASFGASSGSGFRTQPQKRSPLTKGGDSARDEIWYFTEASLAAARVGDYKYTFLDQPDG
jgi:hypothetical protein